MRIPKLIPPDELPPYVEVRTFSGDLATVHRPEPVNPDLQAKTGLWVAAVVILGGACARLEPEGPFGIAELAPVARWINRAMPSCYMTVDCLVQFVLLLITYGAAVRLGFWLLWRFALMRYAAKFEDETT